MNRRKVTIILLLFLAIAGTFYIRESKVKQENTALNKEIKTNLPLIIDLSAAG
ncbi:MULTISPECIES: hypothetical protein [Aminobacterium]|jgi:lipopolysaccharide export system protein LptC|uniref:hypothetical protein n=1 Tax=Aminobacterium TaxID=81466 RepID=UPI0004B3911D|nr:MULTISPECIES: hypothetical protein [Aminobacterium]